MGGGGAFCARRQIDDGETGARAKLDIALLDALESLLTVDDEHQFCLLQTDLQPEGSRAHAVEFWHAPAMAVADQQHAVATLGTEDEAALDELRHNIDGARAVDHAGGLGKSRVLLEVFDGLVGIM